MDMLHIVRQFWPSVSIFLAGFSVLCIVVGLVFSFSTGQKRFDNCGGRVGKIGLLLLLAVIVVWMIFDVLTFLRRG